MKSLAVALTLLLSTPSMASLMECQQYMKQVNKTCKNSIKCKINTMEVSGFDIVQTGDSVSCRGAHNQMGVAKKRKARKNKKRSKKVSFRESNDDLDFDFAE